MIAVALNQSYIEALLLKHVSNCDWVADQVKHRVQPPVTFPIGDHVNVLHDYKKTGP